VVGYQRFEEPCCLHLYPEDRHSRVLQNICNLLYPHMVS